MLPSYSRVAAAYGALMLTRGDARRCPCANKHTYDSATCHKAAGLKAGVSHADACTSLASSNQVLRDVTNTWTMGVGLIVRSQGHKGRP